MSFNVNNCSECAKRWCDFLDPALSHKDWEEEEYDRLLEAVQTYGRSWKLICEKVFPNRSATDIKNRLVAGIRISAHLRQTRADLLINEHTSRYAVAQRRCENNLEFPQNYSSMSSKDMGISSQCKSIGNDSGLDVLSGVDLSNMDTELDYRPQYEEFLPNLYSATASAEALDYSLTSTLPDLLEFAIPLPTTERHPSDQSFGRNPYVSPADTAIPMAMDSFPADYNVIPEENMGYTTSSSSSATGSLFPRGSLPFSEGDLQAGLQTGDTTAKSDNFSNDRKSICSSSSPNSYTVLLEDVKPEMLCEIMNVVVQSTKIVKMKITSSEADQ